MGGVLLAWSALAALVVSFRPGSNALDRFVQSLVGFTPHSQPLLDLTKLGTRPLLVAGAVVSAAVVAPRDRKRALACLVGPFIAAVTVEWVMKPLVGRYYAGVPTFPSGTVTVTTAVATAWVLAVPRRLEPAMLGAGAVATAAVVYAVIALRWHYPTDAMVGVTFASGTVLLVDGLLHILAGPWGQSRRNLSS